MIRTRIFPPASASALVLLLSVGCKSNEVEVDRSQDVSFLVTQEQYEEAVRVARARWESKGDEASEQAYRMASVAFLMDRARTLSFEGEDEQALTELLRAEEIYPDSPELMEWLAKTRDKLADRWYLEARRLHISDDLPGALAAYETVLTYVGSHPDAISGINRVVEQLEYRDGLAHDYYNEGLAALREWELNLAGSRFAYARKYRHWDEKPGRRLKQVQAELSSELTTSALDQEALGFYAAARLQYRLAKLMDPENTEAADGYDRMEVETRADAFLNEGELWVLRGEFERAEEAFEQGRQLTVLQEEAFAEAAESIEQARLKALYESGLNLERDFRFGDAVAAYRDLLGRVDYWEDTRARLTTLEGVMREVEELYSTLDDLESPPARLRDVLLRIDALWPEYADVESRIEALPKIDAPGPSDQ